MSGRWFSLKGRWQGYKESGRTGSWRGKARWSRLLEGGKKPFSGEILPCCSFLQYLYRFGCPHGFARIFGIASYTSSNLRCTDCCLCDTFMKSTTNRSFACFNNGLRVGWVYEVIVLQIHQCKDMNKKLNDLFVHRVN